MRTVSAMQVRKHLGSLLDDVRFKSEIIVLERSGKPMAVLGPCALLGGSGSSEKRTRLKLLDQATGIGAPSDRAKDLGAWLRQEREDARGR
jgi:antitoxin (DNA-binding transcriptional repressor) of toxin-antitoxin stability system